MYLVEVPVEGGGRLLVQVSDAELPGEVVTRARRSTSEMHFAVTLAEKRTGSATDGG